MVARELNRVGTADATRAAILSAYRRRTASSAAWYARASRSLAGGTTGNLRHFQPYPLYFTAGEGSTLIDVDGNRYIDCFLGNGPLLLGHRHPAIVEAIARHASMGSLLVNPPLAIDLAEEMLRTVPCAERVRFLNSGTEAVMTAMRLARAYTGRRKIVKFLGHYHGQDDQVLAGLDPGGAAFGAGIPPEALANTLLCRYGALEGLAALIDREHDIAAILLDPAMHAGGLWGSSTAYLQGVRDLATHRGIVLIFDEVITGFRLTSAGAQGLYGVTPDLATFAKALAAGEKLAAVAGREEILRSLDPERPAHVAAVFQSGTGNDGSVALAAGCAALATYRTLEQQGSYQTLGARAQRLADGIRTLFRSRGVPCHVNQLGSMLQLCLSEVTPSFEAFSRVPSAPLALFYLALINEGILLSLPTSNHIYLSFAHSDGDIDEVLMKVATVLDRFDFGAVVGAADQLDMTSTA
jgi:glutamate-1-semialdehyde 2,1-aminomutase